MNYDSRVLGFDVKKYIEDLKLDMTGKWARLGLLIEFILLLPHDHES